LNDIKAELTGVVGRENILDDAETMEAYSQDGSFVSPMTPAAVVRPKNPEEILKLVLWANQNRKPLVPVSSGPPHFYGDTVPSVPDAVIVDISRMNRIIRIDRRNRMAMVEPGVTYGQIMPELAREGLRIALPLRPRTNKSVVASLLERQPTIIPRYQWSILDPLRCVEVVFGDGNKLMTGDAGSHGPLEEEWKMGFAQQSPSGPGQIDFYRLVAGAQGSMGIVTWASVKCQVIPRVHKLLLVPARRLDSLLGFVYKILRFRFGEEFLLLNKTNLAFLTGNGRDNMIELQNHLPEWVALIGVTGGDVLPEERAAFQENDIRDIAREFGLQLLPEVPETGDLDILAAMNSPSPDERYWKLGYKGGCQDIFFITTLDKTPRFLEIMYSLMQEFHFPVSDMGVYIQPLHQGTSCHCEFNLPFDPTSETEVDLLKPFFTIASEKLIEQGAFFSRPYSIWADMAFNRDPQTTVTLKKIKGIFDPNNIMNPGKLCF
jgi:FAD/FMN-containing dehydrogenase